MDDLLDTLESLLLLAGGVLLFRSVMRWVLMALFALSDRIGRRTGRRLLRRVTVVDDVIRWRVLFRRSQHMPIASLQQVTIITTAGGPFAPDIFWVLAGLDDTVAVPYLADPDGLILRALQQLPDFNHQAAVNAAISIEDAVFSCWSRPPGNQA